MRGCILDSAQEGNPRVVEAKKKSLEDEKEMSPVQSRIS